MKKNYRRMAKNTIKDMRNRVLENPDIIKTIKNPSDEIIKIALKENIDLIQYITNPSSEIIRFAKEIEPQKMKYYYKSKSNKYIYVRINDKKYSNKLKNLSEDGIIELLKNKGSWIQFIQTPTEEMMTVAIEGDFKNIKYINNPTLNLLETLVKLYPKEMKRHAINENGDLIKSDENNKSIFDYVIENLSVNELYSLIDKNIDILDKMDDIPYDLQEKVIKKSYSNLKHIKKIKPEIYEYLYYDSDFKISDIGDPVVENAIQNCFYFIEKNKIKNIPIQILEHQKRASVFPRKELFDRKEIDELWEKMKISLENNEYSIQILNSDLPINNCLMVFAEKIAITDVNIASGFVYKSGLDRFKKIFEMVKKNNGQINLIIGSLRNYFYASSGNKLINIDLNTAQELNVLIQDGICKICTLENRFFHGKYYFLKGKYYSCCMIGSSNLTTSGLYENYELNTLYLIKNDSGLYNILYNWFINFQKDCTDISMLEEDKFINSGIIYDSVVNSTKYFSVANVDDMKNKIQMLEDENLKLRLNLWYEKRPDGIYTDIKFDNLKNYIIFEYKDIELIVLDSLEPSNGYYWFKNRNVLELIVELKDKTKTEIFKMSGMDKRGYHNNDFVTLKKKVDKLFEI